MKSLKNAPLPERTVKTLRVISDEVIRLQTSTSLEAYPEKLRRVEADVEIDGKMTRMVFLTNNLEWVASSISDLYACRWGIETFFKEVKQTLQLSDFFGYNANAVKWQVWTALLALFTASLPGIPLSVVDSPLSSVVYLSACDSLGPVGCRQAFA